MSYILHLMTHKDFPVYAYLTMSHTKIHHADKKGNVHPLLDDLFEVLLNFFVYGSIILYIVIDKLLPGKHLLVKEVVLMYALFYTSLHAINYHIVENKIHKLHHNEHKKSGRLCTMGPDFMDHYFGTSCDGTYENSNVFSLNAIGAVIIVMLLKRFVPKLYNIF